MNTDADLLAAVRRRILREIEKNESSPSMSAPSREGSSIQDMMSGNPEDWDYYVDITREDLPEINPATKKPVGWKKSVHRRATKRGEEPEEPGKTRSGRK